MNALEEFSTRIGEGTEFAATLTCIPDEDNEWSGRIKFDNDAYNWPWDFPNYDGETRIVYNDWLYPQQKTVGAYLMGLLITWHGDIVALFGRVRDNAS